MPERLFCRLPSVYYRDTMFRENHAERRQSPRRLLVNPAVILSVGESRTELLFDLSEGGVSVYGLVPKRRGEVFPVTFDLPGEGSIQASGEIAWTSPTRNRTGIRFLNVVGGSRQRLADWIAAPCYGSRRIAVVRETAKPIPFPDATGSQTTSIFKELNNGLAARLSSLPIVQQSIPEFESPKLLGNTAERSRHLVMGLVAAVALLCLAVGLLHSHLSKRAQTGKAKEITAATVPESPSSRSTPPINTLPATAPPLPAITALDVPGFVLQVGAMRNESNADGLSNSLKQKNLPAFVFTRQKDGFYRVVVGPYANKSSAMRVKVELQRENVEVILKPWVPDEH